MTIVCTGGRDFTDAPKVRELIEMLNPEMVIVGDCPTGLDKIVRDWLSDNTDIDRKVFYADWEKHGKAAGPIRNREMLKWAPSSTIVLAFKGGRGTADCVRQALDLGHYVLEVSE